MRQRGRKSAEALAINVGNVPPRLATPKGLNVKERAEFERLVDTTHPRHFRESDVPMMIAFVQAALLSRKLGRDASKIAEWEKATRTMASLATRLRLTVQSRADPKNITRMGPDPWTRKLRKPWVMKDPTDPAYDADDDDDDEKKLQ